MVMLEVPLVGVYITFIQYFFVVQEVQAEGKYAIDSPGNPTAPDHPPEDYTLGKITYKSFIIQMA